MNSQWSCRYVLERIAIERKNTSNFHTDWKKSGVCVWVSVCLYRLAFVFFLKIFSVVDYQKTHRKCWQIFAESVLKWREMCRTAKWYANLVRFAVQSICFLLLLLFHFSLSLSVSLSHCNHCLCSCSVCSRLQVR